MISIRVNKSTMLAYFGIFIFIAKTVLSPSKIVLYSELIDQILSVLGVLMFLFYILCQKYSLKILVLYGCIIVFTLYNAWVTGNNALVITIITCITARKLNIEKIILFIYKCELVFLTLHTIITLILVLVGEYSITQVIGGIKRLDFGMQHPNIFAALIFNLIIMWVWLNWNIIEIQHIALIGLITYIVYYFCKTRTNLLDMLIILLLLLFRQFSRYGDNMVERIAKVITPVFSVLMMILISLYTTGNFVVMAFNRVLNARVSLGAYAYQQYGITLFGKDLTRLYNGITWDEVWKLNAFTFDSIYSYMLINQGVIWLIVLCIMFYNLAKQHSTKNNIAIISWALYGLTEVQGLNCYSCFPILLVTYLFDCQKGKVQ